MGVLASSLHRETTESLICPSEAKMSHCCKIYTKFLMQTYIASEMQSFASCAGFPLQRVQLVMHILMACIESSISLMCLILPFPEQANPSFEETRFGNKGYVRFESGKIWHYGSAHITGP